MSEKVAIGKVIKQARKKLKLTADQVAAEVNVSRSRVYQWEAQAYVFPKNLPALSHALKIPMRRLKALNRQPRV